MICLVPAAAHAGHVERCPASPPGVEMEENPGNGEAAGHAAGPGYDFVEVGWSALDATHSGDGPAVNVSVSISDHAFLYGNASFVDFEHNAGGADTWRLGAGLHTPVSTQWDVVVRGSAQHIDEGGHASYGFPYEAGLKGKVTPQFEAWIMAGQSTGATTIFTIRPLCDWASSTNSITTGVSPLTLFTAGMRLKPS